MDFRRTFRGVVPAFLTLFAASTVWACSTPVFRYALERWHPDDYEVIIFQSGSLTEPQQKLAERFKSAAHDEANHANLVFRVVDLDQELDQQTEAIINEMGLPQNLPWMVVLYPPHTRTDRMVYSGPFSEENVDRLIDSPIRRQIVNLLAAGQSAVWLLVESGDKEKDDATETLIRTELTRIEQTLSLPDLTAGEAGIENLGPSSILSTELRLSFSFLRISRHDPLEELFVAMLVNSEQGLFEECYAQGQPIAIPVFGRGRAYYALAGEGITDQNLQDLCEFLVGSCSCEVKSENPGADLLFAAPWSDLVTESVMVEQLLPELTGLGPLVADEKTANTPINPDSDDLVSVMDIDVSETDVGTSTGGPPGEDEGNPLPTATTPQFPFPLTIPIAAVMLLGLVIVVIGTVVMTLRQEQT